MIEAAALSAGVLGKQSEVALAEELWHLIDAYPIKIAHIVEFCKRLYFLRGRREIQRSRVHLGRLAAFLEDLLELAEDEKIEARLRMQDCTLTDRFVQSLSNGCRDFITLPAGSDVPLPQFFPRQSAQKQRASFVQTFPLLYVDVSALASMLSRGVEERIAALILVRFVERTFCRILEVPLNDPGFYVDQLRLKNDPDAEIPLPSTVAMTIDFSAVPGPAHSIEPHVISATRILRSVVHAFAPLIFGAVILIGVNEAGEFRWRPSSVLPPFENVSCRVIHCRDYEQFQKYLSKNPNLRKTALSTLGGFWTPCLLRETCDFGRHLDADLKHSPLISDNFWRDAARLRTDLRLERRSKMAQQALENKTNERPSSAAGTLIEDLETEQETILENPQIWSRPLGPFMTAARKGTTRCCRAEVLERGEGGSLEETAAGPKRRPQVPSSALSSNNTPPCKASGKSSLCFWKFRGYSSLVRPHL